MKFQLDISIPESQFNIKHSDKIVLIGSCFSDEMSQYFENAGIQVAPNSFGTIFHPSAIAELLNDSLEQNASAQSTSRNGLYFDWRSSSIFGNTEAELSEKLEIAFASYRNILESSNVLIVTLGTAWGYRTEDRIVANCHKQPSERFEKELTEVATMKREWEDVLEKLKTINPDLKIIFTVSPVRHAKDGLIENNRSKARLLEFVHDLSLYGTYFPSYEIVLDVLRDYRFFKKDLVHPNEQAVEFVWEKFSETYFDSETLAVIKEFNKLNAMKSHRTLYPESDEAIQFTQRLEAFEQALRQKYPYAFKK